MKMPPSASAWGRMRDGITDNPDMARPTFRGPNIRNPSPMRPAIRPKEGESPPAAIRATPKPRNKPTDRGTRAGEERNWASPRLP